MLENITMQLSQTTTAASPAAYGMKPDRMPAEGQTGEGFKGILAAFLSGLEGSMKELKEGMLLKADGTPLSLEALADTLAAGLPDSAAETPNTDDALAALEQLIAGLQAAITQPVIQTAPNQAAGDSAGEDLSLKVQLHTAGDHDFLNVTAKSDEGTAQLKVRFDDGEAVRLQAKVSFDAALPPLAESAPAADAVEEAAPAAPTAQNTKPIASLPVEHAAGDAGRVSVVSTPAPEVKGAAAPGNGPMPVSAAPVFSASTAETANAAAAVVSAAEDAPAERGAIAIEVKAEPAPSPSIEPQEGASPHAAALSAPHAAYATEKTVTKETVPVSRLHEVSDPILKTLGAGDKHLVIKLSPPDLGDIKITLTMDKGVLSAEVKVDSNGVKELFSLALPQIKQSLENAGVRAGEFFVDLHEEGSPDGRTPREQAQQQNQQNRQRREPESRFFDYFA